MSEHDDPSGDGEREEAILDVIVAARDLLWHHHNEWWNHWRRGAKIRTVDRLTRAFERLDRGR